MTPAIEIAKKLKLAFKIYEYCHDVNARSYGEEAAHELGVEQNRVFKTLVISNPEGKMAVAVLPVCNKLNMKKAAKILNWKKANMANKEAVSRSSGYVLGGVSPLGQKRVLKTFIDDSALNFATIFVSAGKRGLEIEINPEDLGRAVQGQFSNISD